MKKQQDIKEVDKVVKTEVAAGTTKKLGGITTLLVVSVLCAVGTGSSPCTCGNIRVNESGLNTGIQNIYGAVPSEEYDIKKAVRFSINPE